MQVWQRLVLIALTGAACAGCSFDAFTYTVDRYGGVQGVAVRLGCNVTYEVFDRPDAGALIVVTNPFNELVEGCGPADLPRAERQRQVAEIYLHEKTDRPLCRITRDGDVTERHREFNYRCPAPAPGEAAYTPRPAPAAGPLLGRVPLDRKSKR